MDLKEYQFEHIMNGFFDGPHATPAPSSKGPVFLGIKNIRESGGIDFANIRHISEKDFPKWTKRVTPREGDIVFSYEATLHRYALIPKGFHGCLGRRMALIRLDPKLTDNKFLYYYFLSPYWKAFVEANKISGATVDRISIIDFPKYKIQLPALSAQKEIASMISAYDKLIDNNNQRIALLEQMAEEIYKEWFVRLRFPGHDQTRIVDGLPGGWLNGKLGEVVSINMGQSPKSEFYNDKGDGLPFHQGVTDFGNRFPEHKTHCTDRKKIAEEDDILLSVRAPVGRLNIADRKIIIGRGLSAIRHKTNCQSYCYYLLRNTFQIEDSFGNGAVFNAVSKTDINNIKIIVPDAEIITRFNELAEPIDKEIQLLERKNKILKQTRDLLLPRLISGKLSVEHLQETDN